MKKGAEWLLEHAMKLCRVLVPVSFVASCMAHSDRTNKSLRGKEARKAREMSRVLAHRWRYKQVTVAGRRMLTCVCGGGLGDLALGA
jgi:hypothetical protein